MVYANIDLLNRYYALHSDEIKISENVFTKNKRNYIEKCAYIKFIEYDFNNIFFSILTMKNVTIIWKMWKKKIVNYTII